ncbi:PREDICTED: probable RNA-binding protein 18 [Acropora digitifera]|uniref:probable RNA-binding protein 18 n=1 Tax=Acropora digitifera TaxID=70779 RepID=UPI00077A534B|nr:PREDICTED: probable RNA-binding protein 18 [Acropora digitifera]
MATVPGTQSKDENLINKLWIGNLDKRLSEYNLIKILQRFGELKSFELLFHKSGVKKGEPRGYCFVEYKTHDNAADAIQGLNGKLALSKPLIVNWAKKQTGRTSVKEQGEGNLSTVKVSTKTSLNSCESKIKAIENKLKLMESGHDSEKAARGKHPLLAQSERTRTHPYKKSRIYNRGKDGKQIR